jgi:tRNA-dihydrouridine synthase
VEIAQILEDSGADAVTIHPRTRTQGFSGKADWDIIGQVKKRLSIPVIGNGDITGPESAKKMLEQTGCDAVMIGRAARGNPWIFSQIKSYLDGRASGSGGEEKFYPGYEEIKKTMLHHLELLIERYGERPAAGMFKKHAAWYTRKLPGCVEFRREVFPLDCTEKLRESIEKFFTDLQHGLS